MLDARIRYAEGGPSLEVSLIRTWNRGELTPVSGSSGLKDYIRNQIWTAFQQAPQADRIAMVYGNGHLFVLLRISGRWFDVSGKQVVAEGKAAIACVTDSQKHVFSWLVHQRSGSNSWYRPSQIRPEGYLGGPSAIGKILRSLVATGIVEVRSADRGNGTTYLEYRSTISRLSGERPAGRRGRREKYEPCI